MSLKIFFLKTVNQATLQPSKVLIEAGFILIAYFKAFPTPIIFAQNLRWYHMLYYICLSKYKCHILTSDSVIRFCDILLKKKYIKKNFKIHITVELEFSFSE